MAAAYLVAILCASWCSTCERFRPDFLGADLAGLASHRLWIDIEDHADAAVVACWLQHKVME